MRQLSLTAMIFVALVLVAGLGGCTQSSPPNQGSSDVKPTITAENRLIPLTLPPTARVILKQGGDKSGRLKSIDPQTQQITLFSGNTSTVAIAAIDKMVFEGEVKLHSGGTIVIRGDNSQASPNNNQKTWKEPLRNFKIKAPNTGQAEVTLTSVTNPLELQGIVTVSQNSSYVVEEIKFEPSDKIKIKVTPH